METKNVNATNASQILLNATLLTDGYKLGHITMYPKGMTKLYSNFTPRSNKHFQEADKGAVVFGIRYFVKKYLLDEFNNGFFNRDKEEVVNEYRSLLEGFLGPQVAEKIGTKHIEALHELGYLPIRLKALPEGTYCPLGVPVLTITNTHPDFAWLTNYLETLLSTALWKPINSATTADVFKRELIRHAMKTGFFNPEDTSNIDFLCHDFSMRGMSGVEDTQVSGMGHLTSFSGSESVPAILAANYFYESGLNCAGTIPATEHSIECANAVKMDGTPDDEIYFKEMLERFPEGFISIVCDGFDYWNVVKNIVPKYKEQILARNGRVVLRPDSGDPVKIICGDPDAEDPVVRMGSYEFLCRTFGGKINDKGYMELDSHIGLIYGDAINMKRQKEIYRQLEEKMIAGTNLVLGIGSFTYQCATRDNLGLAMKATYCEITGEDGEVISKPIFKDPKTVVGMPKKSLRGLITVVETTDGNIVAVDGVSSEVEKLECRYNEIEVCPLYTTENGTIHIREHLLKTVFEDGKAYNYVTLDDIRKVRLEKAVKEAEKGV